ncbi:ABC transporter permease protein [Pectobacterium atrosepticum SCRI1043]|uniref:ABC transporter permease protein n=1 Tax=Pectobacterium atrosepticum (strain SCRI 1043 / ATCC BAA-672) TaxID=218491 RepID=Q6D7I0_PECAS|nr:iron ABC transporter permease [Pectobacterium atrosepticum]AIA70300.1 ABC transporter permease [Pectobacterium atrosepticum]AIK13218.1 ABC transporter permease protein [Pectobacterium atrosepticum]ATY90125.1 iron ABC transporter permease [Pectobacterium atrosepticum]KFX24866.1 ABC transporter permease [Pectobacterium atrosepticum]MBL0893776.1 iron ABC transporter permease [Pectobacterium atrosepticum]
MNKFALLPLLTVAVLFILVGIPVLFVALQAIFPNLSAGSFSNPFSAFADVFAQARLFALLKNTLLLGLGVALCCAVIAIPLGALRGLFALPLARFWDLLFLIPFLIPPYIAGLSWMLALQPRGYAEQILPIQLGEVLFSLPGMIGVMTLNIFPVVYFAVSRSMAASGNRLADVARVHGASSWQAFLRVTLPLSLPATAASLLLAFTLAIEEYGIPAALGSRAGIQVLTTNIEQRLADWPIDLSGSAVLSLLLVAIALCAFTLQRAIVAGSNVETTTGKPAAIVTSPLGIWRWPVLLLFSVVGLLAVGIPLASMLITAFSATISSAISWQNLTWQHFTMLIDYENEALPALTTSLGLAVGSALLTGTVGFLAAWFVVAKRIRGAAVLDGLSMLPAALPGIVVGVGLILAWNQRFWPITPYNTWVILLLSYSCLLLPYPVRYSSAALAQIGSNLESAARVHGASAIAALRLIVFPLVFPSLLAAMMLVFAVASRELVTSLLLSPAGVQTVSIFVWRQFEQGSVGDGMAMASVAVFISLSVMLLALRFHSLKTK